MAAMLPYQRLAGSGLVVGAPGEGTPEFNECFQAASYDLRIGKIIAEAEVIDGPNARFYLPSGGMATIVTMEQLQLPPQIGAVVFPPNSLSEQGLLVLNPGHVDPGYRGTLSVRVINLRKVAFPLSVGMRIFTCLFFELSEATERPYQYAESDQEKLNRLARNATETMSRTLFETQAAVIKHLVGKDIEEKYVKKEDITREGLKGLLKSLQDPKIFIVAVVVVWAIVNLSVQVPFDTIKQALVAAFKKAVGG